MKSEIRTFLTYVRAEAACVTVYVMAGVIGGIICFFTSNYSVVPFIVPLFVQILAKANVRFRQRHQDALVELPAQKEDPVFIMDTRGRIILSVGKTYDLFEQYGIQNIKDFISEESFKRIIGSTASTPNAGPATVEVFSNQTLKWYEVKATITRMASGGNSLKVLAWFQDISLRQIYYLRLKDLLRYSDLQMSSQDQGVVPGMESRHLAIFLLKEYEAVFIARADQENNLDGHAFKVVEHTIEKSPPIQIHNKSSAPINRARQNAGIISGDVSGYSSMEDFLKAHPFDPQVLDFIDLPIRNFITYNEADVSIIAFNFRSEITIHEREFFKMVVNIYRSMAMVVDLKAALEDHEK